MSTTKPARPSVKLVAGHATTTSTALAQFFVKRHYDVLRAIENLKAECEPEFYERNFALIQIDVDLGKGRTRKDPAYQLTRDGFTLLAMGFTGKAALAWKIKYIEAFNHLEARAQARAVTLAKRKLLADQLADQAAERRKLLPAPEQSLEAQALARLRAGMFVMYFGTDGFMMLHSVSRQCVIAEPGDLAGRIADPKGDIGREHLSGIIQAAAKRLA